MYKFLFFIKDYFKKYDPVFWICSIFISMYSLILIFSVSRLGFSNPKEVNFFKTQLLAVIIGYLGAIFLGELDYHLLCKHWKIVASLCFVLMALTFVFGISIQGSQGVSARAWIKLPGGINFQPSEFAKIGFIITLATHLNFLKKQELLKSFLHMVMLGVHALVPTIISHLQGDDGAAIVFVCIFLSMTFASGVQLRYFLLIISFVIISFPVAWKLVFSEYQKKRILAMFDLEKHALDIGFQQIQGKISIGSGRIFGQGLFCGPRVEYNLVPVQESDYIFSVAGEELGFLGCVLIITLLLIFIFRTFRISLCSCDDLGFYICFGFFGLVLLQTIFNIGMCLNILPVMGVTLPFFSSGGSSAACLYLGLGIVQSVYSRRGDADIMALDENTVYLGKQREVIKSKNQREET